MTHNSFLALVQPADIIGSQASQIIKAAYLESYRKLQRSFTDVSSLTQAVAVGSSIKSSDPRTLLVHTAYSQALSPFLQHLSDQYRADPSLSSLNLAPITGPLLEKILSYASRCIEYTSDAFEAEFARQVVAAQADLFTLLRKD